MLPPEERRRILNRVIHQNPYDERPALWIYLLWLCLTTRTGSGNLPDFVAAEIETGYSSDFLQQGFLELADYGRTVQAVMRGVNEEREHRDRVNNRLSPIQEQSDEE
ncbi:hypothetical protein POX_d05075 [Penicillium oxalicum]|uniref:hypothetical protein n=1 Tax=Penicillium oxalicum TaxID=69781 RepID=UPI0020B7BF73|nr:hypothetical protein POX_d05075 [Penicillium oxalicum]KAI2789581.1 hypothetical protein POX_d05075 [Penicillium oxalicum]